MKIRLYTIYMLLAFPALASFPPIELSTQWFGDQDVAQKKITSAIEDFDSELHLIRNGLRETLDTSDGEQKKLLKRHSNR